MIEKLSGIEKLLGVVVLLTATAAAAAADNGSPDSRFTLLVGPYVYHYSDNAEHNNDPWLVGLEWKPQGSWVDFGATYFRNSFYQDSVYAYVGKRWFMGEHDQGLFLRLTGGPLYGYRGEYEDKVPYNHHGLGIAIIPGIGYHYRCVEAQFVILGTAAFMVTFGYDFQR